MNLFKSKKRSQHFISPRLTITGDINLRCGKLSITGVNRMNRRAVKSRKKLYRTTFTYFIPSPPPRKNGYREIEVDKIMRGLFDSGFELETYSTQSSPTGIFLFAVLSTTSRKVYESDHQQDLHDRFKLSHTHSSPDILLEEEEDA